MLQAFSSPEIPEMQLFKETTVRFATPDDAEQLSRINRVNWNVCCAVAAAIAGFVRSPTCPVIPLPSSFLMPMHSLPR